MTPKEAFKIGFLLRCADEALTGDQVSERMQKAAAWTDLIKTPFNWAGSALKATPAWLLGASAATGILGGYATHKMMQPTVDEEDVKKQELINELRAYAKKVRDEQTLRSLRIAGGGLP